MRTTNNHTLTDSLSAASEFPTPFPIIPRLVVADGFVRRNSRTQALRRGAFGFCYSRAR